MILIATKFISISLTVQVHACRFFLKAMKLSSVPNHTFLVMTSFLAAASRATKYTVTAVIYFFFTYIIGRAVDHLARRFTEIIISQNLVVYCKVSAPTYKDVG